MMKVYTRQIRSGSIQDVSITDGAYNEYYLPALLDSNQEMWIEVTDSDSTVTKLHLKR